MNKNIHNLQTQIDSLEAQLNAEIAQQSAKLQFGIERGRIRFEEEVRSQHEKMRTSTWTYLRNSRLIIVVTAPVIYSMIIPLVLFDVFLTLYQLICFPAYGISPVKRRNYLIFDRLYLAYLNPLEKFNCAYCSYASGLIAYSREILSRTEAYWCPIKHARRLQDAHALYRNFADYGDVTAYQKISDRPNRS